MPLVSDLLKIKVIESHISGATSFSSIAVIPSGPGLFDAFRLLKMDFTSETGRHFRNRTAMTSHEMLYSQSTRTKILISFQATDKLACAESNRILSTASVA